MRTYKAVLFAPDGDWVTDYKRKTIDEVWDAVNDRGSTWFFYPFPFIIRDHGSLTTNTQRIISCPDGFEEFKNAQIRTVTKWLKENPELVEVILNA